MRRSRLALLAVRASLSVVLLAGCDAVGDIGSPGGGAAAGGIAVLTGNGGAGGGGLGTGANASALSGLPCDVQALLVARCTSCHASPPLPGVPVSLTTLADLTAPSHSDPTRSEAALALARMQDPSLPMPPAPFAAATASEIAAFGSWVSGGYKGPACGATGAGGATGGGADAGVGRSTGTDAGVDAGSAGAGGTGAATGLPCDVQAVLSSSCTSCHAAPPLAGVPMSLVTYADLTGPSHSDPTRTAAQLSVARMQSPTMPMPPAPGAPATAAQIATLTSWISGGYARGTCGGGSDGGASDGGAGDGPTSTPPKCTSGAYYNGGTGPNMAPGQSCASCHRGGEAQRFTIAGTVYPTAHEPDNCNGTSGSGGGTVVIVGASGQSITLTPNTAGNFYYTGSVSTPFTAKVTYMGRERLMTTPQTSGDCNSCHTQNGASSAPGRIMLP
jgi:hypothetical protein